MKGRASGKQTNKPIAAESVGEIIGERDRAITMYIEWLGYGIEDIDKLLGKIQKDGLARMSIRDFAPSLENLGRECFISWIEDIEGRCFATAKYLNEYHAMYRRYACKVSELTRAIKEHSPNNQQAQQLAVAIDRLYTEVSGAIEQGTTQYLTGNGKPQPADLLTDTRHGALWDSVENAIVALSTAQAETPISKAAICAAVRAEVRGLKCKNDAKATKESQLERAAQWLKDENAAGRKASIVDAARHFAPEIQAEKIKGGYADTDSIMTALNKKAAALGIEQFISRRTGNTNTTKKGGRKC